MAAAQAAIYTFNERALVASEDYDWDNVNARLFRYALAEAYYSNIVYRDIATFSGTLKAQHSLYRSIRGVYNPVYRLVEAYGAKVYGGTLDFEDLSAGAIPIRMATPELMDAIKQVWLWSNWQNDKTLYVRTGAKLGDSAIKIVDEPDKGRVRMEVLHPGKIKDITVDAVGNVKAATIEYRQYDAEKDRWFTYTEKITKTNPQTVHFATFRDGKPYAFNADTAGNPMPEWDVPYGFIPLVVVHHKNVGMQWGANAFNAARDKIDEINDAASLLNDQTRKAVNVLWYFAGVAGAKELSVSTNTASDDKDRDKMPAIYGPADSVPTPMIANVDIAAASEIIAQMLLELERDMPELALHRLREGGNLTAPGVRAAYDDAVSRFKEAQGVYDDGLIRAHKMAVTIGGFRGYDGFAGFGLDSYERGDLDHIIAERPVVGDDLSKSEKINALQAAQAPSWLILQELGYDDDTIKRVLAWEAVQKQAEQGVTVQATQPAQITAGDTVSPERRPEVTQIAKTVAQHSRTVTGRASANLLAMSDSEWEQLVNGANGDDSAA